MNNIYCITFNIHTLIHVDNFKANLFLGCTHRKLQLILTNPHRKLQ